MKKKLLLFIAVITAIFSQAQMAVTITNAVKYEHKKKTSTQTFVTTNNTFIFLKYYENFVNNYNMYSLDNSNNLKNIGNITVPIGTFNNSLEINNIHQLGNKVFALVENRNKDEGKNKLTVRYIAEDGKLTNDQKEIGSILYTKRGDPGTWLSYVTEDKKHLAIVMVNPYEKGQPLSCKYCFYDENLNVVSSGNFSIGNEKKKSYQFKLLASNAGDFYLINEEFDKSYIFPVVYKKLGTENTFNEFPVLLKEPFKNFNYTAAISNTGNLVLAGYYQEKKGFIIGDVQVKGVWVYNTEKPTDISTQPFDKPMKNLVARGLTFIENTMFITGEDVKEEREASRPGTFEERIHYIFGNIVVTGYDLSSDTKYDLLFTRNQRADYNLEYIIPSFGIINGKYNLLFNDSKNKYESGYAEYDKVPVIVSITKEGLMEQPVNYEKIITTEYQKITDKNNGPISILPAFGNFINNHIICIGKAYENYTRIGIFK